MEQSRDSGLPTGNHPHTTHISTDTTAIGGGQRADIDVRRPLIPVGPRGLSNYSLAPAKYNVCMGAVGYRETPLYNVPNIKCGTGGKKVLPSRNIKSVKKIGI